MADSDRHLTGGLSWKVVIVAGVLMLVFAVVQLVNSNWIFAIIQGILGAVILFQGFRARRAAQGG